MRFFFFLLLVINLAFGAYMWMSESQSHAEDPGKREINREELKIVSVTDAPSAVRTAARVNAAKQLAESLSSATCIEMNGVRPADAARAQQAFSAMNLAGKLMERRVEEVSRYWVFVPAAKDRKTAETTVASLKKQGITEVSMLADNAISLGVFSSEEAAARYLGEVKAKGARNAEMGPRNSQVKEHVFTVREPDTNLVARLTLMQAEYEGSALKAVTCSADPGSATQAKATPSKANASKR